MNGIIDQHNGPGPSSRMAEPLHIQRLEAALDMRPFMQHARDVMSRPLTSPEETEVDDSQAEESYDDESGVATGTKKKKSRKLGTKQERQSVKAQLYNFSELTADREWLYDIIMSDTDTETEISDEDDYVKEMLKTHMKQQKLRENFYKKPTNTQYAYYGSGLLSNHDMFTEHQQSIVGVRKRKRRTKKEKPLKLVALPKLPKIPKIRKPRKMKYKLLQDSTQTELQSGTDKPQYSRATSSTALNEDDEDVDVQSDGENSFAFDTRDMSGISNFPPYSGRGRRRRSQQGMPRTPEALAARRKRVWQLMAKKELGRHQRARSNNHKEMIQNCKRAATMCMKVVRQRALHSQKVMKETVWRAKRLTREMLTYWKRYERLERDNRRRLEKEAEEQRKIDVELIEVKRQQRKLNFLITQTELYAHFMSRKLGQGTEEEQLRILNQLDEEANPRLAAYDDYNADEMKELAKQHAAQAFDNDRNKTKKFDVNIKKEPSGHSDYIKEEDKPESLLTEKTQADLPQPSIFRGSLKAYQIKGMTWLANIYDQGISGILADEMGLGKTVQSIAFLCHIAEHYGVWGPFLVISPASTLHNWQQEMERFAPDFNVVPYWGSPNERKILRQFWEQKDLHKKEASFHVVITSYQLIVSDYKYFNRIKWQYMVLDEAQAIKSATSMRWKLLLGFNCRNRLLLSGTPIQNSMAELWALLHFIMPTLFDSHDEFNEWFSKDIESHAENKTGIDEKQISRLHMILKPFMLRRIKKDVENELSDKIEIMVYCPLTIRQKLLYMALKQKIRIEDLLNLTRGGGGSTSDGSHHTAFTSNLMNLVMQFRKVCNHPELFERRDAKSPFAMKCQEYVLPRLVFDDGLLYRAMPSQRHLLYNRFSIFKTDYSHHSLFKETKSKSSLKPQEYYSRYIDLNVDNSNCFSFSRLCDLSPKDLEDTTINGLITFFQHYRRKVLFQKLLAYRRQWWSDYYKPTRFQLLEPTLENPLHKDFLMETSVIRQLLFTGLTSTESSFYAFGDFKTCNMQETIEHRVTRSKYKQNIEEAEIKNEMLDEAESELIMTTAGGTAANSKKLSKEPLRLLPEFEHKHRLPQYYQCEALEMPRFIYGLNQKINTYNRQLYCESRAAAWSQIRHLHCENPEGLELVNSSVKLSTPRYGWSSILIPDKETLISDAGKLAVLDSLLTRLKKEGHRVLIYSQMTKMIDLLEEYMWHRKHRYMRLDGSSKISARRDMVADFQSRQDIFVFLLSTRAGGLGINLTAADTVIFYDSDWNPTVDQQAMDRAHRLGQTKQVTVYRLICKGTIEERILQRAREKSEIQRMVISGGNFKPDTLKPKEVVSLLLDDEEIEAKYRQKIEGQQETASTSGNSSAQKDSSAPADKRRRQATKTSSGAAATIATSGGITIPATPSSATGTSSSTNAGDDLWHTSPSAKRMKLDVSAATSALDDDSIDVAASETSSTSQVAGTSASETYVPGATSVVATEDSENEALIVDCESPRPQGGESPTLFDDFGGLGPIRRRHHPRGTKRGRPRGSTRRGGGNGSTLTRPASSPGQNSTTAHEGDTPLDQQQLTNTGDGLFTPTAVPTPVKRGPGRPRIKTGGPVNQGARGAPRTRKPIGPLVVPLGSSPAATPINRSPAMSPAPSPAMSMTSSSGQPGVENAD
ncbi:LOW QUALITY PROTEIN: chromatin-remodeling ATPase INO80 [Stomoxys calcitrans]|uniref:LOW QUALITY PROTEIN: chromatin-remodeling ATPase INO80 n=1 Tax=Stomoxys calcitrans TaxID=35570 RepID=UPI0027E34447|nr:LOW QUALITY PROTEIN: chromatin-remodeling ATPase INO80 [Stomoxys calcitrans]